MPNIVTDIGSTPSKGGSQFTWRGAQTIRRVHALNERCLELLTQIARTDRQKISIPIVHMHRALWRGLNATSRRRAARMPFLLVNVNFQSAPWWCAAQNPSPQRRQARIQNTAIAGKVAGELMRETLMLAWSTATFDRGIASVLLGMSPAVTSIVTELGPQDVERIASRYRQHLCPRWQDFPAFWGKLLTAARDGNDDAIQECRLHGVQLIGGELLSSLDGKFV